VTHHLRQLPRLAGLLIVVSAAIPAVASARTQWFYEREPVAEGQVIEVPSRGTLKLKLKLPKKTGIELACNASGIEAIWNSPEHGLDETRSINFACTSKCGEVVIAPVLPWTSILEGTAQPLLDQWNGVQLGVTCGTTSYGDFTGTLMPTMGDGDAQAGKNDDLDTELRFTSTGPRLSGPNEATLSFRGFYHLGPSRGHGATGEV
jgi:hypothetical protein